MALTERVTVLNNKKISFKLDVLHKSIICQCLSLYSEAKEDNSVYPVWLNELLRKFERDDFLLLSVEEIAQTTNYRHEYVSRTFKKYIGKSLKQYLNEYRLSRAIILLGTSNFSVEEIGFRCGFCSLSNFINAFKKEYGVAPGVYRKSVSEYIEKDWYVKWND